jgi:MFS family permease
MRTRSQVDLVRSHPVILWQAVAALAALYGSFTLAWVIYRVHLPTLLTQFRFPPEMAPRLLLIEAILAIAVEPLAGMWSDRTQQRQGTRFPTISQGIFIASALFVLLPALVSVIPPVGIWPGALIGLLIVWAIAMSWFRSPAVALLGRYASALRLPQAASWLTFAGGIAGAAMPLGSALILNAGIAIPFVLAATLLLATTAVVQASNPVPATPSAETTEALPLRQSELLVRLGLIASLGFAVTLAFRLAIETFPKLLKAQLPGITPPLFVGIVFLAIALAAIPGGRLAVRVGNRKVMLVSAVAMAVGLGLMPLVFTRWMAVIVAVILGASFGLISNGTLPLTLTLLPLQRAGLAVGVFFGGVSLAASIFAGILGRPDVLSPIAAIALGIVTLGLVGWCVLASRSQISAR